MRYAFGRCRLDTASRELIRDGEVVHLSPKGFALLRILVDARPRVVTKAELMEYLWPDTFVVEANLPVLVGEVRTALGDQAAATSAIKTHHGVGYSFVSDVRESRSTGQETAVDGPVYVLHVGNRRILLGEGTNTVGRDQDSDVYLNDASVSRHHARIVIDSGSATVEDLDSKNGTLVRGAPALTPVAAADGDELEFGRVKARLAINRREDPSTLSL